VDFTPDEQQQAILDAVDTILGRFAGPERMRHLGGDEPQYDHELHRRLDEAGYLDLVAGSASRLEGVMVVERVARRFGVVASGHAALIAPALGVTVDGPVAMMAEGATGPVRFAADAAAMVIVGPQRVRLVRGVAAVQRVGARLGWPVGESEPWRLAGGDELDGCDPAEILMLWRLSLAAELVGCMRTALHLTVEHVTAREQFGRPIGTFQAVQHGLARCAVGVEGARWLTYEAAWSADPGRSATALAAALTAAERVRLDTHQFTGALGFTTEYDLHLATMRLVALGVEARTLGSADLASARSRWSMDEASDGVGAG